MKPSTRLLLAAGFLANCLAASAQDKLPLPSNAGQKQAAKLIANLYRAKYDDAKTNEQKSALAKKLLQVGTESKDDATARYVLFRIASDIAAGAGDADTAFEAVIRMDDHYQIDILAIQSNVLAKVVKTLRLPEEHQEAASKIQQIIDAAIEKDRFDIAKALHRTAKNSARQARSGDLLREVEAIGKHIEQLDSEYQNVATALAKLRNAPTDPEANLRVGNYRCFIKGDWENGLPMLALGNHEQLKTLATKELAEKDDPVTLGDLWWAYSENVEGQLQTLVQQRAALWYQQAMPRLQGIKKKLVESRLDTLPSVAEGQMAVPHSSPTDDAIRLALSWLVEQQRADGSWSLQTGPNPGNLNNDVAATSFALIPLLRAGNTHEEGAYATEVTKGLEFLIERIGANGDLRGGQGKGSTMYVHGLAALAVCEAYARSGDRKLKTPAQAVVNFIVSAQDPKGGGWRYSPRQAGDTSVLGWQMTPLMLATNSKLGVPRGTFVGVSKFLDSVQADGGSSYGYTGPGQGRNTTAIGLLVRLYLGVDNENQAIRRGIARIVEGGPSSNVYLNYYATQLLYLDGSEHWPIWKQQLRDKLLASQEKDGQIAGSWFRGHEGGGHVDESAGRLGVTSFCVMALQAGGELRLLVVKDTRRFQADREGQPLFQQRGTAIGGE